MSAQQGQAPVADGAFPDSLIDKVAEAIRNDGGDYNEPAWAALPEDRKAGWRGDAERALAVVKDYLTAELPGNFLGRNRP